MGESQAIGIRLDNDFLSKIETLSKEENLGRSTAMRMLMEKGYKDYVKEKSAKEYIAGKTTISRAAENAGLTVWEMEQYLVSKGFKSDYSAEDLKEELDKLEKSLKRKRK